MYFWVCWEDILNNIGNEDEGGTPVTMPNTEVKPLDAEDTWDGSFGENMELPIFLYIPR